MYNGRMNEEEKFKELLKEWEANFRLTDGEVQLRDPRDPLQQRELTEINVEARMKRVEISKELLGKYEKYLKDVDPRHRQQIEVDAYEVEEK